MKFKHTGESQGKPQLNTQYFNAKRNYKCVCVCEPAKFKFIPVAPENIGPGLHH